MRRQLLTGRHHLHCFLFRAALEAHFDWRPGLETNEIGGLIQIHGKYNLADGHEELLCSRLSP
jgi:hypothetical protein